MVNDTPHIHRNFSRGIRALQLTKINNNTTECVRMYVGYTKLQSIIYYIRYFHLYSIVIYTQNARIFVILLY